MRPLPRFGPYQAVRELARGGMGVVYEAVHDTTGARHAVKTVLRGAEAEEVARFRREAEVLGRLDHPHVVRVHAAELAGPTPWMAQDLLPGGTLADRLARGPLAIDDALALARKLADALGHAHARGVLHRDLKPTNVVFDDRGEPRLVDFGLGRSLDFARLTATGTILGTPGFMAPELALGERGDDARTDVYGLGALLYAALTTRAPFEGSNAVVLFKAVTQGDAPPLRRARPDAPVWLEALVARALARRPEERFQDAAALLRALDAAGSCGAHVLRRGPLVVLSVVASAASLAGVAALLVSRQREPSGVVAVSSRSTAVPAPAPTPPPAAAPARATPSELTAMLAAAEGRDLKRIESLLVSAGTLEPADARRLALACLSGADRGIDESRSITMRALQGDAQGRIELIDYFRVVGLVERIDPSFLTTEYPVGAYQHYLWTLIVERSPSSVGGIVKDLLGVAPANPVLVCLEARLSAEEDGARAREVLLAQLSRLRGPESTGRSQWLRLEVLGTLARLLSPGEFRAEVEPELVLVAGDPGIEGKLRKLLEWNEWNSRR